MTFGTLVTYSGAASFASSRDISVDFGSGADRACIGHAYTTGSVAETITSVVIDPAGANIACTLGTEVTTAYGSVGARARPFWLIGGTVPTGVKTVRVTCGGANGKPGLHCMPLSDITSLGSAVAAAANNSSPTLTLTGTTADVFAAFVLALGHPDTSVMTPTAPNTLVGSRILVANDVSIQGALWTRPGVSSGTVNGSWSSPTPTWQMFGWVLGVPSGAATGTTLTGPSSGTVGVASSNFTSTLSPGGGTHAGLIVTPSDGGAGGTFAPATVTLSTGTPSATFTYTAASAGAKTISVTNNGGLTNPSNLTYTASSSAATATTLTGPSSGTVGVASTNFTVGANGTITGTVIVTPSDSANGGSFSPTTVSISSGSPTGTFTYTPASTGVKSISTTNNGGLSNPSAVSYTASAVPAPAPSPTTGIIPFILVIGLDGKPGIVRI